MANIYCKPSNLYAGRRDLHFQAISYELSKKPRPTCIQGDLKNNLLATFNIIGIFKILKTRVVDFPHSANSRVSRMRKTFWLIGLCAFSVGIWDSASGNTVSAVHSGKMLQQPEHAIFMKTRSSHRNLEVYTSSNAFLACDSTYCFKFKGGIICQI